MPFDRKQFVFVERKKALHLAESCGLGIVKEEAYLYGYQIYIIEQWLCDRSITSNTIKVFTGNQQHSIKVCVLSISTAELQHPRPEIQAFFNASAPLKLKHTGLGEIMLTDPSELPCDMDMVLVPDGDYDKWINQAYVNINLRRTNCTGRSALNLNKPNPASEEKFRSIYKIADTVPFEIAVINLVTVAQVALYLFNLLKRDYIDGLICNETSKAFWEFYTRYHPHKSPDYQLKEPWMEPHLLTALISKLVLCRNKLHAYNFTTIKDPFTDYEEFRFDIEEYQRAKGLKRTKFLDLATLDKLNEHTINQLKVRNVIKSKLDDISGVSNSPLFSESSEPEVFRHHATIESLRAIWRPRLRNTPGGDLDKPQHELLHMIKGMSARTTRTSGAAAEILSKFAGSLPWVENKQGSVSRNRSKRRAAAPTSPPPVTTTPTSPAPLRNNTATTNIQLTSPSGLSTVEDVLYQPDIRDDSNTRRLLFESGLSSDDDFSYRSDSDFPPWRLSSDRQDTPPPPTTTTTDFPTKRFVGSPVSLRPETASPVSDIAGNGASDFMPLSQPHRAPMRSRSVSDSIVSFAYFPPSSKDPIRPNKPILPRANSLTMIPAVVHSNHLLHNDGNNERMTDFIPYIEQPTDDMSPALRPSVTMDVETYLVFEKLQRQHTELREAYQQLQKMANVYERRAEQLRTTWLRRSTEFEQIERAARKVMDEQLEAENELKEVDDSSAKLHYELNVLNENLKDVEENVSTFYSKVSLLERKMHESQQSITTMLIIGNYFDYYWRKIKRWAGWSSSSDP
ncbi:hypothetical protein O0I10_004232 [Lichtheimia ornata]|uniref:STB6-like N-terminal domain-containing protein n=1 Tax=Lichtheimia ornata TaxID=688661 RepID=A0AAD7XZD2_9FUNG|nr:uncharacterized protein O0I10_004232 [Lichtheimia ornata]KAJ8660005.1 hypothetical protein O0I10_004232 [Lichtheimia ornata]